ncbi:MAG: DegT/DnrJ/EryC1/StrS family aminotransferase, partial [Deltaproteobacteria bacterium]
IVPETLLVNVESMASVARAHGARAMLPTHTEGATVDVADLVARVGSQDVFVLEDGAHALGAEHAGEPVGRHSSGVVVSFGPGKHLNTLFGGVVITRDATLANALREERVAYPKASARRTLASAAVHWTARAVTARGTYPYTMHTLVRGFMAAGIDLPTIMFEDRASIPRIESVLRRWPAGFGAMALRQVDGFRAQRARRRELAALLREHLTARGIRHQIATDPGNHPLVVTVLHERRDAIRASLLSRGIDTQPTWMRAIRDDEGRIDPAALKAERQAFYLPLHEAMSDATARRLLATLDRVISEAS